MIDSIISRHVTRSNTSFRPSCFLTFVDQRNWKFVETWNGGGIGVEIRPSLPSRSFIHWPHPRAQALLGAISYSIGVRLHRVWPHQSAFRISADGSLSPSLFIHLPSPRSISLPPPSLFCLHLAIGFVARFLLKPLRIVFKSVRSSLLSSSTLPALSAAAVTSLPLARSLSFIRRSCKILRFRLTHPSCCLLSSRLSYRVDWSWMESVEWKIWQRKESFLFTIVVAIMLSLFFLLSNFASIFSFKNRIFNRVYIYVIIDWYKCEWNFNDTVRLIL